MFTSWEQVRSWIEDNGFPHWVFYKKDPEGRDAKDNDIIIDSSNFTVSDMTDKLEMTEKYLRMYGGRTWGLGFKTPNGTTSGTLCEVRLESETPAIQPVQGFDANSIGELRKSITAEIMAKMKAEQYEKERKDFEREKKEFEEEKKSAIGALIHYFAPVGQMMLENKFGRKVAGVDANEPVHAAPIVADRAEQPEDAPEQPQEEEVFTDEESEKLFDLMARFKKVEPRYLELIEAVVTMAENGDGTYNMAKGVLLK